MRRGDIWWAALPAPVGSGPGMKRPVLVVQANPFNESRISTVIVAVITSNLALAEAPGNVRLGKAESGLPKPSVVNVSQVLTVDRSLLEEHVRVVSVRLMERVNLGLRLALGL
ncbi:MAG: type II toxin-antitoxin system PemK/MazF family toxin [Candidatus Moraniibacteriota bacterium]